MNTANYDREKLNSIKAALRERNHTIDRLIDDSDMSLRDYLAVEAGTLEKNKELKPHQSGEDLLEICHGYIMKRADRDTADQAVSQLRDTRAMLTSDHLGGLYSPQSFQGDLLFTQMLKDAGYCTDVTPVFQFGLVSMCNSTNPRGIMVYEREESPLVIPLFPRGLDNTLVTYVPALTRSHLDRAKKRIAGAISDPERSDLLTDLIDTVYSTDDVLDRVRYANQIFHIARGLFRRIIPERQIITIEVENVLQDVFLLDMENPDSLLRRYFDDDRVIEEISRARDENDKTLSSLLFWGIDDAGRKFTLDYRPDRKLKGRLLNGETVSFDADIKSLCRLVKEKRILPALYSYAIMAAWDRGFTWYGGIFQSNYLSNWQNITAAALSRAGREDLAEIVRMFRQTGYVSGPIFALSEGASLEAAAGLTIADSAAGNLTPGFVGNSRAGGALVNAGPVEFLIHPVSEKGLEDMMSVSLHDSHMMGAYEFYNDLLTKREKTPDWYRCLTEYYWASFSKNTIMAASARTAHEPIITK